jgi:hypothetical protein
MNLGVQPLRQNKPALFEPRWERFFLPRIGFVQQGKSRRRQKTARLICGVSRQVINLWQNKKQPHDQALLLESQVMPATSVHLLTEVLGHTLP